MADLNPLNPIQGLKIPEIPGLEKIGGVSKPESGSSSFSEVLSNFFQDVNKLQVNASESVQKISTGEIKDIHQVMVAMSEADVAFKLMMEIRNKLMQAYSEIMKTPL